MAASISPGAKRKIPIPNETGKFQEKCFLTLYPKQVEYNTILDSLSIGRYFPKQSDCKRPVKWSANRIITKAKQQEIANEVREKIIDSLNFRNLTGKRDR